MNPATGLPWVVGEYDECLGYDCMSGGVRAGPVVLDAADYGQEHCADATPETMAKLMADAKYIAHAANAYQRLVEFVRHVSKLSGDAPYQTAEQILRELGEL